MSKVNMPITGLILAFIWPLVSFSQGTIDKSATIHLKDNWYVQQSEKINQKGPELSVRDIKKELWYKTTVPSTVMGVLTRNGLYKDLFVGENYKNIDKDQFNNSWWYYKQIDLPELKPGQHVSLHFDGISYYANIWFNGKLLASKDSVFGPYRRYEFDITGLVQKSNNKLAVEVFKAGPGDFNLGFVDWNPRPVDENMGIWREVTIKISGNVSLSNTYVESKVNTATLDEAELTIRTTLKNFSAKPVNGFIKGSIENWKFSYPVHLEPGISRELVLNSEQVPSLHIKNPRLWWCNNLGSPELYSLYLCFEINNQVSDNEPVTFGIREIECYTDASGSKGFKLNGKKVLIKGAGWTDDLFLRDSLQSLETQIQYVKHMNLNTLRFESIWGNTQAVYDLCDKYGIMAIVGWSCQWEWDEYLGKSCDDFGGIQSEREMELAIKSFRDQVLWLRNHPSIFVWLVGSDKCPRPELETRYMELFKSIDNRPYLASAGTRVSDVSGPTGVKMNGPYEYVAPNYWYIDTINGGAFGFNTETGPGPQVPVLESLKKMIPADKLWPPNEAWNYHCTHSIQAFNTMDVFNKALDERFGKPANLQEYLLKSDAQSYEAIKAMFEAFRVNIPGTTGIIQWMLNSAWPSLYWQLYDYYLRPTAAYYAVRKANEPLQLCYDYGDNSVYTVNETKAAISDYKAIITLLDVNSRVLLSKELNFNVCSNKSEKLLRLDSISGTVLLDLKLLDANGNFITGNFYWLNSKPDEFAWDKTYWAYTPMKSYTDYTALNTLQAAAIKIDCEVKEKGDETMIKTILTNPTNKIALFVSFTLLDEKGNMIVPVLWDDNYVSLLPGEKRIINCSLANTALKGNNNKIMLSGWNIKQQQIELK